jgi:hypothetical protein
MIFEIQTREMMKTNNEINLKQKEFQLIWVKIKELIINKIYRIRFLIFNRESKMLVKILNNYKVKIVQIQQELSNKDLKKLLVIPNKDKIKV